MNKLLSIILIIFCKRTFIYVRSKNADDATVFMNGITVGDAESIKDWLDTKVSEELAVSATKDILKH